MGVSLTKKNVVWWPAVRNPDHDDKFGGYEYFQYSRNTWEYWCKKNDVLFVPFEEPVEQEQNLFVHGYPVSQKPFNPMFDVQKQLPIYSKTQKSKSLFCAGYYIICFEKGWRKAYCPKLITLQRYPYKGPMKTKLEMQQILNNAIKEQNTNTSN